MLGALATKTKTHKNKGQEETFGGDSTFITLNVVRVTPENAYDSSSNYKD